MALLYHPVTARTLLRLREGRGRGLCWWNICGSLLSSQKGKTGKKVGRIMNK
jgi:hypothetical protein